MTGHETQGHDGSPGERAAPDTEPEKMAALYTALAKARGAVGAARKDSRNDYQGYTYASAEGILTLARVLSDYGLALVPAHVSVRVGESYVRETRKGPLRVSTGSVDRRYRLVHADGGSMPLEVVGWPWQTERGRPEDKAVAGAVTTSLRYMLRDLLCIPQVDQGAERNAWDDRGEQPHRRSAFDRAVAHFEEAYWQLADATTEGRDRAVGSADGDARKMGHYAKVAWRRLREQRKVPASPERTPEPSSESPAAEAPKAKPEEKPDEGYTPPGKTYGTLDPNYDDPRLRRGWGSGDEEKS